jgi:hypothetical protein
VSRTRVPAECAPRRVARRRINIDPGTRCRFPLWVRSEWLHADDASRRRGCGCKSRSANGYSVCAVDDGHDHARRRCYRGSGCRSLFQLFVWRDRDVSHALAQRAQDTGFRTLILTVELPVGRKPQYPPMLPVMVVLSPDSGGVEPAVRTDLSDEPTPAG